MIIVDACRLLLGLYCTDLTWDLISARALDGHCYGFAERLLRGRYARCYGIMFP
jgi:hypothetical protein